MIDEVVDLDDGIVAELRQRDVGSGAIVGVGRHGDASLRPWQHRCWIFPRDPQFQAKAGRILDLYERRWQGQPLH